MQKASKEKITTTCTVCFSLNLKKYFEMYCETFLNFNAYLMFSRVHGIFFKPKVIKVFAFSPYFIIKE